MLDELSYFTDLQGSQTQIFHINYFGVLSYFTDLQGSQTNYGNHFICYKLSYFTDLQGSQTNNTKTIAELRLVTLLIYKVLKLEQWEGY